MTGETVRIPETAEELRGYLLRSALGRKLLGYLDSLGTPIYVDFEPDDADTQNLGLRIERDDVHYDVPAFYHTGDSDEGTLAHHRLSIVDPETGLYARIDNPGDMDTCAENGIYLGGSMAIFYDVDAEKQDPFKGMSSLQKILPLAEAAYRKIVLEE